MIYRCSHQWLFGIVGMLTMPYIAIHRSVVCDRLISGIDIFGAKLTAYNMTLI
jgi:hypothetical protein